MTTHQDTSTERELLLVPAMLDAYIEAIKASGEYERWHYIPEVESARDAVAQSLAALSSRDEAAQQPQGPSAEDVRELSKWLNEEVSAPINRQALARVLAVQQPQERDPSGIYQIYGSWVVCVDGTRIPGTYQSWLGARLAPALPDDVLLDLMNKAAPNDISDKAVFSAYQEHQKTQAQQAAAVPAGFKLVPVEPTEEMIVDGMQADVLGRPSIDDDSHVLSIFKAMLEAAPPAPVLPLSAWQPIETAPKDGTYVLVSNYAGCWVAHWAPIAASGFKFDNPWRSVMLNHDHIPSAMRTAPTHWQPLPAPPITAPGAGGEPT